jgi:hypothetical protein
MARQGRCSLCAGGSYDVLWMLGMAISVRGRVAEVNLDIPAHWPYAEYSHYLDGCGYEDEAECGH